MTNNTMEQQRSQSFTSIDDGPSVASSHDEVLIAAAETRAVARSRVIVAVVLILSTVSMACGVYFYMSNAEEDNFNAAFASDVQKVFDAVADTLDHTLGAADSFVVGIISLANYVNATWPFVTVPDFAVRTAKLRSLTKAVAISKYHLVETVEQRAEWETYVAAHNSWVDQGLKVQKSDPLYHGVELDNWTAFPSIFSIGETGPVPVQSSPNFPAWQSGPIVPFFPPYNWDVYATFQPVVQLMNATQTVIIGPTTNAGAEVDENAVRYIRGFIGNDQDPTEPFTDFFYPIVEGAADVVALNYTAVDLKGENTNTDANTSSGKVLGIVTFTIFWREFIRNILPPGPNDMIIVIGNECNQTFTYQIMGPDTKYLGSGDKHESKYESKLVQSNLNELYTFSTRARQYTGLPLSEEYCPYWIKAYPSQTMEDQYTSSDPIVYSIIAVVIFVFTSIVFVCYDYLNEERQKKVMKEAVQSSAIVSSLFPSSVRDRLYKIKKSRKKSSALQSYLSEGSAHARDDLPVHEKADGGPIADVFPETTVLFADIAGFTAWSSVREPSQVFILLETLYGAFDAIAKRRKVFKVETIGDSYVAVTGLPEPNPDHALAMTRFARDCRDKMEGLVLDLEITLGPGTADLKLRFGLHSGPVTAGVLRGAKSRFQLFGDTVNTASRMESNGIKGRIHVSQSTADLLIAAGREHWVTKRDELVEAKGKGAMQTYWVEPSRSSPTPTKPEPTASDIPLEISTTTIKGEPNFDLDDKTKRLIDWNVDVLSRLLRQIISNREVSPMSKRTKSSTGFDPLKLGTPLDEVKDVIDFPSALDLKHLSHRKDPNSIQLDAKVIGEMKNYISAVAKMYGRHPFHNFEHAAHITMSLIKHLSRIIPPTRTHTTVDGGAKHDHTFGITADPLTQFACVFVTLIHNVDHPGVPNAQLVEENSSLMTVYKTKSIAEQNSFDVAWHLLMDNSYRTFRQALLADSIEMQHFRQLVVNLTMATDVLDTDLQMARHKRFVEAFSEQSVQSTDAMHRQATIVLEYLIQASVIAHTMQHCNIYLKWNGRLFEELYTAFVNGRVDEDPSTYWYTSELKFFNDLVIPLAQKLKTSGVFGPSATSNEYLTYAEKNRQEWEQRGIEGALDMMQRVIHKLQRD